MPPGKKSNSKKNNLEQVNEGVATVVPSNEELPNTTNNLHEPESETPINLENGGGAEVIQPNTTVQAKVKQKRKKN
uniref:Uncharacterized protein n=1 Tax=viral metagenome TaxID=1070528 RepID=A0A6C0H8C3_9ZZZZ